MNAPRPAPSTPLRQRVRRANADELQRVPWWPLLDAVEAARVANDMQVADAEAGEYLCRIGRPANLWFGVVEQALQIVPLFYGAHLLSLAVRMIAGDMFPGWWILVAPAFEALLWPLVTLLLLAPQRRAPDPDQNRPL